MTQTKTMTDAEIDGQIIWRWTPTDEQRSNKMADVAQEYAIESNPQADSGIVVHAKYHDEWQANPWSVRPVIAELLKQPTLAQHIDRLRLVWYDEPRSPFSMQTDRRRNVVAAKTDLGMYRVWLDDGERWYSLPNSPLHPQVFDYTKCDSIDDGKSRCESDFKSRVRAIFEAKA